jgi:FMN reductase
MHVLGLAASPREPSSTRVLVEAVLDEAAGHADVTTSVLAFADRFFPAADGTRAEEQTGDAREVLSAIDAADAVVIGMPVYRGSLPGSLKNLLDLVPRGQYDGDAQALRAKPVAIVATGASDHHFLAIDDLAAILRGFFAAYVVPPGVYASRQEVGDGELRSERVRRAAVQTGSALVDLQRAIAASPSLAGIEPLL